MVSVLRVTAILSLLYESNVNAKSIRRHVPPIFHPPVLPSRGFLQDAGRGPTTALLLGAVFLQRVSDGSVSPQHLWSESTRWEKDNLWQLYCSVSKAWKAQSTKVVFYNTGDILVWNDTVGVALWREWCLRHDRNKLRRTATLLNTLRLT